MAKAITVPFWFWVAPSQLGVANLDTHFLNEHSDIYETKGGPGILRRRRARETHKKQSGDLSEFAERLQCLGDEIIKKGAFFFLFLCLWRFSLLFGISF